MTLSSISLPVSSNTRFTGILARSHPGVTHSVTLYSWVTLGGISCAAERKRRDPEGLPTRFSSSNANNVKVVPEERKFALVIVRRRIPFLDV